MLDEGVGKEGDILGSIVGVDEEWLKGSTNVGAFNGVGVLPFQSEMYVPVSSGLSVVLHCGRFACSRLGKMKQFAQVPINDLSLKPPSL